MKSASEIGGVVTADDPPAAAVGCEASLAVDDGLVPVEVLRADTGVRKNLWSMVDATAGEIGSPCGRTVLPMITSPAGGGCVAAADRLGAGLAQV